MQSSILARKAEDENKEQVRIEEKIKSQISAITNTKTVDVETFKLAFDKVERGTSVDFALRVIIRNRSVD